MTGSLSPGDGVEISDLVTRPELNASSPQRSWTDHGKDLVATLPLPLPKPSSTRADIYMYIYIDLSGRICPGGILRKGSRAGGHRPTQSFPPLRRQGPHNSEGGRCGNAAPMSVSSFTNPHPRSQKCGLLISDKRLHTIFRTLALPLP